MHNIEYRVYSEEVKKETIKAELDEYVRTQDYQEGCSGLDSRIRWYPDICENRDQAERFLKNHDTGWYVNLAVKYREPVNQVLHSKKLNDLKSRAENANLRYHELADTFYFKDAKSTFVGCKECGSRLNIQRLGKNFCPVCNADLRPASVQDKIHKAWEQCMNIRKAREDEYQFEIDTETKKSQYTVKWLVKFEYHT